ncbi:MAG: hypothetical protein LBB59_07580 [Campylobacteraceae bacterium]|jgi:hypothetical protein|nr:hypothetical protein [Campylobacteraceae bacterium]
MKEDFNKLFWNILGVKHRVYGIEDLLLFEISNKEAKQKQFERFTKSTIELSNIKYFELLLSETIIFRQFFCLKEEYRHLRFCVNQITSIILNYKLFLWLKLDKQCFSNMLAFQTALIIEYIYKNNFDTKMLDESLKKQSFYPFVKGILANDLAYAYIDYLEILKYRYDSDKESSNVIDKINQDIENNYKKKIAQWEKKKTAPSFIDIMVISLHRHKKICEPFFISVIQMLIAGVLFRKKYYYKEQLDKLRKELKKIFNESNYLSLLKQRQYQYLIPIGDIISTVSDSRPHESVKSINDIDTMKIFNEMGTASLTSIVELLSQFCQCEFGKMISQKLQESQKKMQDITKDITSIFNDKQYKQVIKVLDGQNALFYQPRIFLIQFIAAMKLNDNKLVKKYFKLLNREFGNLFTPFKNNFEKIAQNTDDLDACIEEISKILENVGN